MIEKSWLGINANIVSPRRVLLEFCRASYQPFWQLAAFPQLQCIVWPAGAVSMVSRQLSASLPLLTLLQTPTLCCWYQNLFDGCHVNILCVSGIPKLSAQRSAGRPTEWGLSCVCLRIFYGLIASCMFFALCLSFLMFFFNSVNHLMSIKLMTITQSHIPYWIAHIASCKTHGTNAKCYLGVHFVL